MQKIKVKAFGKLFDAYMQKTARESNGAHVIDTLLIIPKTKDTIEMFQGWRLDQSITFNCYPDGDQDFFLTGETPGEYHFG